MNAKHIGRIIATLAFAGIASYANAQQQLLFSAHESIFPNTSVQSTPPAAMIMSAGVCIQGLACLDSGFSYLNPLTFYPSSHVQTVTVTSSWGSTFDAFASVFGNGGDICFSLAEVLSNDGLAPNFFQDNSESAGCHNLKAATATSVEIEVAPFTFQQTINGWWIAVGTNGKPPLLNVNVYGTY
jgi:hypothetical protein